MKNEYEASDLLFSFFVVFFSYFGIRLKFVVEFEFRFTYKDTI
ncbi:hypothetical protein C8R30_107144, partial [Nitrosomonas nitrosa]